MKVRKKTWVSGGKKRSSWMIDYYHPVTGERVRHNLENPDTGLPVENKAEADLAAAQLYANVCAKAKNTGHVTDMDKNLTLETLLKCHRERVGKSEWTYEIEEKQAKNINRILPGKLYIEITTSVLESYVKTRKSEKGRQRPAKAPTIMKELALIRQAARWGFDNDMCPAPNFKLPKLSTVKPKPKALDPDDLHELFMACGSDDDYLRQVTEVYYYTGLRRMELFRLRWDQVDLKHRIFTFVTHKGGVSDEQREDVVYLSDRVVYLLTLRHKVTGGKGFVFGVPADKSYMRSGKPTYEPFDYRMRLRQAAKRHGMDLKIVTPKTLRSSCATNLFKAGADSPEIVSHLRHRDGGKMLMEHYAHVHEKALRQATTALENLGPKKGTSGGAEIKDIYAADEQA